MPTYAPRLCDSCIHLRDAGNPITRSKMTCTAYPQGIPVMIVGGFAQHNKEMPGDHGVRWERDPDKFLEASLAKKFGLEQ